MLGGRACLCVCADAGDAQAGDIEYFIKWVGCSSDENTWQPEALVRQHAPKAWKAWRRKTERKRAAEEEASPVKRAPPAKRAKAKVKAKAKPREPALGFAAGHDVASIARVKKVGDQLLAVVSWRDGTEPVSCCAELWRCWRAPFDDGACLLHLSELPLAFCFFFFLFFFSLFFHIL